MSNNKMNKCALAVKLGLMVGAFGLTMPVMANDAAADDVEVIEIRGIRASTQASINAKRFSATQQDSIAAEDIGKLPDVTIADSLQRISGVQIERVAGAGGPVQIRGLPQVDTTLNGEVFLSATTINRSAADFGDLPAQLFSGVDVFKASEARHTAQGIAGAIDLRTRRPFEMDDGFTFAGNAELTRGSITKESDPTLSALLSYRADRWGIMASAVTAEATLATDYNGYFDTSENGGIGAANNNFTWGPGPRSGSIRHVVPQGFSAFNKTEERDRNAFHGSFQADLGSGFEFVADVFYTDQERFNARSGFSQNNRWQSFNDYAFPLENGWTGDRFTDADGNEWGAVNAFELMPYRMQTFTQVNINEEKSRNLNLELNYNGGGALTGQVRVTRAHAAHRMRHGYGEGDMLSIDQGSLVTGPGAFAQGKHCTGDDVIVGQNGGCYAQFSPGGIESQFMLTYDASGKYPVFGGFDQLVSGGGGTRSVADYMADINSYHIGAFSSEGNFDIDGNIDTFSTRWNYEFDGDFIRSIDFGIRQAERKVSREQFTHTSTFGGGCDIAQWKAVDQFINGFPECEGNPAAGEYLAVDAV
ncbi:MAG: TonB-dependent receptor plug domain-containing protein, partial [Alkalimonas sp.]|nr:TonB-dependent receptor plug domain-containing protein [Alkalimonas sp.]